MQRYNFFQKYFASIKNVRTFAPDFEREITAKSEKMPHSSSGPGHLPLTQKIISSTLICGTKPPQNREAFFILLCAEKVVSLHLDLWDVILYIWPITVRVTMVGKHSLLSRPSSRRWRRLSPHSCGRRLPWWAAAGRTPACTPAISTHTSTIQC